MKHIRNVSVMLFAFILSGVTIHASEEEHLPWRTISIDCGSHSQTGKVSVVARTDAGGIASFEASAFGKSYSLKEEDLKKIRLFPLRSLQTNHAGSRLKDYGHSVSFRLRRQFYDSGQKLHDEEAVVIIYEKAGLRIDVGERKQGS